jgi:hypothetical protein
MALWSIVTKVLTPAFKGGYSTEYRGLLGTGKESFFEADSEEQARAAATALGAEVEEVKEVDPEDVDGPIIPANNVTRDPAGVAVGDLGIGLGDIGPGGESFTDFARSGAFTGGIPQVVQNPNYAMYGNLDTLAPGQMGSGTRTQEFLDDLRFEGDPNIPPLLPDGTINPEWSRQFVTPFRFNTAVDEGTGQIGGLTTGGTGIIPGGPASTPSSAPASTTTGASAPQPIGLYNVTVRTGDGELSTISVSADNAADARANALAQSETGSSIASISPVNILFSDFEPTTGVDPQDPLSVAETRTGVGDFFAPAATLGGFGDQGFIEGDLAGTAMPDGGVFESTAAMPALTPELFQGPTYTPPPFTPPPGNGGDNGGPPSLGDPDLSLIESALQRGAGQFTDRELQDLGIQANIGMAIPIAQAIGRRFPTVGRQGAISDFLRNQAYNLVPAQLIRDIRTSIDPTFGDAPATLDQLAGRGPATFTDFYESVQSSPRGALGAFQDAASNLNFLRGIQSTDPRAEVLGQYFNPADRQQASEAFELLGAAQQGTFSPLLRSRLRRPSESEVLGDFILENNRRLAEGQRARNFLDFAAGRFGL